MVVLAVATDNHFVLHDIPKGQRQEKVEASSKKLKKSGRMFIKEPVDKDNENLPEETRHTMASAGLREISFESDESALLERACQGIFEKAQALLTLQHVGKPK